MSDSTGYYGAWNNALSASAYWQNVYDQKAEYAPCYYDATHVMTGSPQVNLPGALVDCAPVGLSIVGARGSDLDLAAVAREFAAMA